MTVKDPHSVVITGASRGIGRAIALYLARHTEHPLILIARSEDHLGRTSNLCKKEGAKAVYELAVDLTDPKAVEAIELPDAFNRIAVLINNAGGYLERKLSDTDYDSFIEQFEANVVTAFNATKQFLPVIRHNTPGYIVNICSRASIQGLVRAGAYSAAKHGLLGYTRSLRQELKAEKIAVTAINLGATHSSSWEREPAGKQHLINPLDVAALIGRIIQLSPQTVVEEITINPIQG